MAMTDLRPGLKSRRRYRRGPWSVLIGLLALWMVLSAWGERGREVTFHGGPEGGVFLVVAQGLAELFNSGISGFRIVVSPSGGSPYNLERIAEGRQEMGIVYGSDVVGEANLGNVRGVCRLYSGVAHLAVLEHSRIRTLDDLKGARVAVGLPGSATARSAQRFFARLGLWEAITKEFAGYDLVEREFRNGQIDALWQLTGRPGGSLNRIAGETPIRFLELGSAAVTSGFFRAYPDYSPAVIQAGTYPGVGRDVPTFQDQALWVASRQVDADFIYQALQRLYSPEGLARMRRNHPVGEELEKSRGQQGLALPLHEGAERFWRQDNASSRH